MENKFFTNKFVRKLLKFIAFIVCWTILAKAYIYFNPTTHYTYGQNPNKDRGFLVCVVENGKPISEPLIYRTPTQALCEQPSTNNEFADKSFILERENSENQWQFTVYTDSPSDPWVFHYRVENQQVIPLWYTYGGLGLSLIAWTYTLFITMAFYAILNRIIRHKNKKPSSEINQ